MRQPPDINRWPVKLALFAMGIGAAGMLLIKPIIVGGLMDSFGYSPRQAGFVAGVEMAGVGLGTLIVVLFGPRWDGRRIAATGAAIALMATIGPTFWSHFVLVLLFRLCAGIGCGVLVSVVIAAIAVARDPDRSFSLYYMTSAVAASMFFPLATALVSAHGVRAAYFFVAILLLPVFPLLRQVPATRARQDTARAAMHTFPLGWAAVSLSASTVYWIGTGAVWAFIERIGIASGLPEARIGATLAGSQLTFVLGALAASLLHTRIGRAIPAVTGVLLSLLAVALIHFLAGGFAAGLLLYTFAWMFFFPYLSGAMAAQDASGRLAVLGVPAQTLGLALGPAIAGTLVREGDFAPVLLMGASFHCLAILLLLPALLRRPVLTAGASA